MSNGGPCRVAVPFARMKTRLEATFGDRLEVTVADIRRETAPPASDLLVVAYDSVTRVDEMRRRVAGARHVQTMSVGHEWISPAVGPEGRLYVAAGAVEDSTAEHALALLLASFRRLSQLGDCQRNHEWKPVPGRSIRDARIVLVGYGRVGQRIEKLLHAFGPAEIRRVASRERKVSSGDGWIHGPARLRAFVEGADAIILAAPYTSSTHHLVNAEIIEALPDGCSLVNVARAGLVDQSALLRRLLRGEIHTALDVTHPEPLDSDSQLWGASNSIVTPHVGANTNLYWDAVLELIEQQIERLLSGRSLLNEVQVSLQPAT